MAGRQPEPVRAEPHLHQVHRLVGAAAGLGVPDAAAGTEVVQLTRPDQRGPSRLVAVGQRAGEHPGEDLDIAMGVHRVAGAGLQDVLVAGLQGTEAEVGRVVVRTERERVRRIQPVGAGTRPVGAAPDLERGHRTHTRLGDVRGTLSEATISRIEQSSGALATRSLARMDEQLAWFRRLPADQRSWVMLVAQAGIGSFVEWLRSPDQVLRLAGEVFGTAPRELARRVSLQQTVELVRQVIAVVEEHVPSLAGPGEEQDVADAMLRFSREIAFAAARVYAGAAETRGRWDARLEALVIDALVRGAPSTEAGSPVSQLAALGWRPEGAVTTVVGSARLDRDPTEALDSVHRAARRAGFDVLAGVHGGRLVVVLGGITDPLEAAKAVLQEFDDAPVVVGGSAPGSRAPRR